MKKILIALLAVCSAGGALARGGSHHSTGHSSHSGGGAHHVSGHVTKSGSYVAPHRQTNPNHTQRDNWSSKPNVNPDTGKAGHKEPSH